MYGIFCYIYHKHQPNVGKYTIHGSYGYANFQDFRQMGIWQMGDQGYFLLVNGNPFKWSNVWKVLCNQKRESRILHTNLCFKSMVSSRMILGKVDTTIPKPACCRRFGGSPLLLRAFTRIAVSEDWLASPAITSNTTLENPANSQKSFLWSFQQNRTNLGSSGQGIEFLAIHPRKLTWIPKMMVWKRWFFDINMAIFRYLC